jgi:hypothetical protein
MSNIIKSEYASIYSSDSEELRKIVAESDRAIEADDANRKRSYENWKAYFAVDGGQWETEIKDRLTQENRHASQYNIIGPKVDALTGSLIQEETDLDWKPIEGVRNTLTESVKTAYYSDKELSEYHKIEESIIRDGLINSGDLKIKMSSKYNPLKNIAFDRVIPGYLIKDPNWITDNDDDLMKAWEIFHVHPEEIAHKYGVSNRYLDEQIKYLKATGDDYDTFTRNPNYLIDQDKKGSLVRVIEYHYIEKINTTRLIGMRMDSQRWIPFPITEDRAKLEQYMIQNNIDPMTIMKSPYEDRIHHVKTLAPEAVEYDFLEDGISTVQCGRLPYISFTANRVFGQNKGIVDDLVDIQRTINKRESKLTDMISTAQGGGKLVNKNLFDDPVAMERFKNRANDPSYIEFVEGEELSKERAIHYINSNQYPSQIINQLMRMWDIVDRVSKVPAALEAISENANESGVLFQRKLAVARVNTITIINRIRDFRKKVAEAYYNQFQLAYNGPERTFSTTDGKRSTTLNARVFNEQDGKVYIQNRPDQTPRCQVIATESRRSPNRMMQDRAIYSELYNLSVQTNPEYASFFFELLLSTMDLDEEHKQRLLEISTLQKLRDKQRMHTEIDTLLSQSSQAKFAGIQADMGVQQLLQQLQGQQQDVPVAQIPQEEVPEEPLLEESTLPSPEEEQEGALVADLV